MKKHLVIMGSLAMLLALTGCMKKPADTTSVAETDTVVMLPVETGKVKTADIHDYRSFGGEVVCAETMDIVSETSGKIVTLAIKEGDKVEKDQVVALIDQSKPGLNYQPNQVKAPRTGTVSSLNVQQGGYTAASMSMGKVISTDDLEITFSVAEKLLSEVRIGSSVDVRFDAYPDALFHGKVTKLGATLDTSTRTRKATCVLEDGDERIIPGLYARVSVLVSEHKNAIVIPSSSQATDGSVYVIDASTTPVVARKKSVKTGIVEGEITEVLEGLSGKETIVVKGQNQISDGSPVNIIGGGK